MQLSIFWTMSSYEEVKWKTTSGEVERIKYESNYQQLTVIAIMLKSEVWKDEQNPCQRPTVTR